AGPLPPRETAELVEALARAVQAAHDGGVVHRDLKPANVLIGSDGRPKVTDFGLSKRVEGGDGLTRTGAILGTPRYMAPEQAVGVAPDGAGGGAKRAGPPAGVAALGALPSACFAGRPPFQAATPLDTLRQVASEEPTHLSSLRPAVPRDLQTVCHECLQKDPA